MKISLLENGMDSLQRGFESVLAYERDTFTKAPDMADYFNLKQAILSTHHGIEILLKYVLMKKSEFLIVSKIDAEYMQAYREKEKQKKSSVFESSDPGRVHTIAYEEALERVEYFTDYSISVKLKEKLKKLNVFRNALTHAEIDIPDDQVILLFQNLLNDLDLFFYNAIGPDFRTCTGYGRMMKHYAEYMKYLDEKDMKIKKEAMDAFVNAMNKAEIAIGPREVIRITDINKAKRFISEFEKAKLHLGTDLYNGYCSGDCRIRIIDDKHLAIYTLDNKSEYRFKFLSLILCSPILHDNSSPVIILESDDDGVDSESGISLEDDYRGGKYYQGICFVNESNRITYDSKEIYEFYEKCDNEEGFEMPEYYQIYNFINRNTFACINVQGLEYWRFNPFLRSAAKYDGHQIEIALREAMKRI